MGIQRLFSELAAIAGRPRGIVAAVVGDNGLRHAGLLCRISFERLISQMENLIPTGPPQGRPLVLRKCVSPLGTRADFMDNCSMPQLENSHCWPRLYYTAGGALAALRPEDLGHSL